MSIDERLRLALRADDLETEGPELAEALRSVEAGARRRRAVHAVVVSGLVAACLAVTALVLLPPDSRSDLAPTVPPPSDTSPQGGSVYDHGPIDGQWMTGPITRADVVTTLDAAGLGSYAEDYARNLPEGRFRFAMTVFGGSIAVRISTPDGGEMLDQEFVRPVGQDRVRIKPLGDFADSVYAWDRTGGVLRLELLRCGQARWGGFPREVYQRVLYTSAPFHQVG